LEKRKRISILREMERLSHHRGSMRTCVSLLLGWKYVKRMTSTIETNWTITRQKKEERINSQEISRPTLFYSK
jgi:hypothetical protein